MSAGRLILGQRSPAVRREIGPSGWVVLEGLHDLAINVEGTLVATTSTRRLSEHLGTGKDAISRALRILSTNGLVTLDELQTATGQFDRVSYRLHTSADVLGTRSVRAQINAASTPKKQVETASPPLADDVAVEPPPASPPTPIGPVTSPRRRLVEPVASVQLYLFPPVDATTNVGSNQRSKGSSRTCISDARNVALLRRWPLPRVRSCRVPRRRTRGRRHAEPRQDLSRTASRTTTRSAKRQADGRATRRRCSGSTARFSRNSSPLFSPSVIHRAATSCSIRRSGPCRRST